MIFIWVFLTEFYMKFFTNLHFLILCTDILTVKINKAGLLKNAFFGKMTVGSETQKEPFDGGGK